MFHAPVSTVFEGVLPANEVVICSQKPEKWARGMWLVPDRYDQFEEIFIPHNDRKHPDYTGYAIWCPFRVIGKDYVPH